MTELHSVDVLTDGQWVPVRGVLRWQGEHMVPIPKPRRVRQGKRGICGCGEPAHSAMALYCAGCWLTARRAAWRKSSERRRNEVAA